MNITNEEINSIRRFIDTLRRSVSVTPVDIRIMQSKPIGARVIRTATQTLTTGIGNALSWDTSVNNDWGLWDSANPDRITVKHNGYYSISAGWGAASTEVTGAFVTWIYIVANGNVMARTVIPTISGQAAYISISTHYVYLNSGETVYAYALHSKGSDLTILGASTPYQMWNWISIVKNA